MLGSPKEWMQMNVRIDEILEATVHSEVTRLAFSL